MYVGRPSMRTVLIIVITLNVTLFQGIVNKLIIILQHDTPFVR